MRRNSWISVFLIAVMICACVVGCGNSNQPKTDETFISNLSAGLQARWKIADSQKDSEERDNAAQREYLTGLVDKELEKLGAYSDYTFNDSALSELAKQYFDALSTQKEGIAKYGIDDEAYEELFGGGYSARAKLISKFYDSYGLTVKDEYNDDLENLIKTGYAVIKGEETYEAIQNIIGEQVTLTALGGDDWELAYTNSTDYDLNRISINLKFYDENGAEVGNESEYDTVSAGAKSIRELHMYNVPEFTSAKMAISYTTDDNNKKDTEYRDISVVNNMTISIVANNLPVEVSSTSSYYGIMTTAEVTSVSTEEGYWTNGKCTLHLNVSGKKIYDREGDQSSDSVHFLYKVFDGSGNIVSSGSIYASEVMVGDNFTSSDYVSDMTPGEYTVEFYDYSY